MVSAGKRTVFRALEELEADGWLTRRPGFARGAYGGGLRQVNSVYRLELPETVTRRKGRGSARPQVIGDPADDRSATHGTTVAAGESRPAPVTLAPQPHPVVEELAAVRPDELSPRQALDLLYRLKQML